MTGQLIGQVVDCLSQDGETIQPVQADLTSLLTVAKNKRRRDALDILATAKNGEISLGDLAERIASREYDCPVDKLASEQRKRVYIALKQCHLEKLEEAGFAKTSEHETRIIATDDTSQAAEIIDYLETVTGGGL